MFCEGEDIAQYKNPPDYFAVSIGKPAVQSSIRISELKSSEMAKVPNPEVNIVESTVYTDPEAERSYLRKIDFIVLPTLCLVNI